jgi:heptosyltransferase-1
MMNAPAYKHDRILIVNLGGIGDFLLSTPALRLLKSRYPEAKLSFLGVPRVGAFARNTEFFQEVFTLDVFDPLSRYFLLARWERVFVVASVLRSKQFDIAINMRTIASWGGAWKMHLLFRLINARTWVGRDTDGKGYFFHIKVPEALRSDQHETQHDLETIAALGVDIAQPAWSLGVDPSAARRVNDDLDSEGVRPFDPVAVVYVGGAPSHRWPLSSFVAVAKSVRQTYGFRVVIVGGAGEARASVLSSEAGMLDIVVRIGRYSLDELIALIARCRVFIGNDAGPMHMAAILKVPLVAIVGGGYLGRFDPRKISDKAEVLRQEADCAPCDRFACRSMKCLKVITPADVMAAVGRVMQK